MGIDNMLAVGGASHGNFFLLLFGLMLSIPFVVFMSSILAKLMDRFPIILYIGSGILGKVGGEMMITDPVVHNWLHPLQGGRIRGDGYVSPSASSPWADGSSIDASKLPWSLHLT